LDGKRAYFKGRTSASQADDVPSAVIAAVETPNIRHSPATLERPEWVGSGSSALYHPNGRYRAHTGCSTTIFQKLKSERLLFPKAVIQSA